MTTFDRLLYTTPFNPSALLKKIKEKKERKKINGNVHTSQNSRNPVNRTIRHVFHSGQVFHLGAVFSCARISASTSRHSGIIYIYIFLFLPALVFIITWREWSRAGMNYATALTVHAGFWNRWSRCHSHSGVIRVRIENRDFENWIIHWPARKGGAGGCAVL